MSDRGASWAIALLLVLSGCASEPATLGEGSGSSIEASAACPPAGVEPLAATTLRAAPSRGQEGTLYCGRDSTYVLASPPLENECVPDGFPCPGIGMLSGSPATP
jgi:hypothetical protein